MLTLSTGFGLIVSHAVDHFVEIGFYWHYLLFRTDFWFGFHDCLSVMISLFFLPESELCMASVCCLSRQAVNVENDL